MSDPIKDTLERLLSEGKSSKNSSRRSRRDGWHNNKLELVHWDQRRDDSTGKRKGSGLPMYYVGRTSYGLHVYRLADKEGSKDLKVSSSGGRLLVSLSSREVAHSFKPDTNPNSRRSIAHSTETYRINSHGPIVESS